MSTLKIILGDTDRVKTTEQIVGLGDGRHELGRDGGFTFYAHVADGKVTGYSADQGDRCVEVEVFDVRVKSSPRLGGHPERQSTEGDMHCYRCVCVNSSCACEEIDCAAL
jgi:hypothetical protein